LNNRDTPFLNAADLSWNDELPVSRQYRDSYFSTGDGLEESRYVFLEGADVRNQWRRARDQQQSSACIMELGFGSGLNFLATLDAWTRWQNTENSSSPLRLRYFAVEGHPMRREQLRRVLAHWRPRLDFCDALIERYPPHVRGQHRLLFEGGSVELVLLFDDVRTALAQLVADKAFLNTVYLDGFAPSRNPAMWQHGVLQRLAELSLPQATLATFSAMGELRRCLERVGFTVKKRAGFGVKREMLTATRNDSVPDRRLRDRQPWYALPEIEAPRRVAVIGAGLSGSTSARALADRGVACTVFDSNPLAASMASSVPVAGWFPQISLNFDQRSEIYWQACRMLESWLLLQEANGTSSNDWFDRNGCFFVANTAERQLRLKEIERRLAAAGLPLTFVAANDTRARIGVAIDQPGLDCALGGSLGFAQHVRPERSTSGAWQIRHDGGVDTGFDAVILATGSQTDAADSTLPVDYDRTRGHVTLVTNQALISQSRLLCFKGHLTTGLAASGAHVTGATTIRGHDPTHSDASNADPNIARLRHVLTGGSIEDTDPAPRPEISEHTQTRGVWHGQRLATRDRLPLLGPVPEQNSLHAALNVARKTAAMRHFPSIEYEPGLFVNLAHGGRGATTAILTARLLAEMMVSEPLCLPRRLVALTERRTPVTQSAHQRFQQTRRPPDSVTRHPYDSVRDEVSRLLPAQSRVGPSAHPQPRGKPPSRSSHLQHRADQVPACHANCTTYTILNRTALRRQRRLRLPASGTAPWAHCAYSWASYSVASKFRRLENGFRVDLEIRRHVPCQYPAVQRSCRPVWLAVEVLPVGPIPAPMWGRAFVRFRSFDNLPCYRRTAAFAGCGPAADDRAYETSGSSSACKH